MNRTKPVGIRFDPDKLEFVKVREKLTTNQQVVDLLMNRYWWEWKIPIPTAKEAPPLSLKAETIRMSPPELNMSQIALKSFEQWKAAKIECENAVDWEKIKEGIEAATNLSRKQKDLLIKYS